MFFLLFMLMQYVSTTSTFRSVLSVLPVNGIRKSLLQLPTKSILSNMIIWWCLFFFFSSATSMAALLPQSGRPPPLVAVVRISFSQCLLNLLLVSELYIIPTSINVPGNWHHYCWDCGIWHSREDSSSTICAFLCIVFKWII